MKNKEIQVEFRKSARANLKDFCVFAMTLGSKKNEYSVEVTEWVNQEGYDIIIQGTMGERNLSLTYGEIEAIKACIKSIENHVK